MDSCTNCASNLVSKVCGYMFLRIKGGISYVFHYKRRVENFEKKVETLKERRDRVRLDVDAAKRNVQEIHSDVNSWLSKADKVIHEEVKQVKDLEGKANNKCLISLCPNFKLRYQLSKKAEEDTSVVDELLQQGEFDKVSYSNVPQAIADAPPRDFEAFDSRKKVFDEIMEALKDPNINIVGVYGMPGVGKTTLVKEVARQVRQDKSFDSVVIAAVTQTPDIIKIQDQVAELLGLKLEEKSVAVRAIRLHQTLKAKKSLVVLDNVWTRLDLKEVGIPIGDVDQECTRLGIPIGDVHKGCTILVTSRDVHVLQNKMDAQKSFPVGILKEDEAWNLFKKMAGNSLENPDLQSIAIQIAKRCAGLPIAISTVARALRNKALFEWTNALLGLQRPSPSNFKGVPGDAYSAIELSYVHLESEELKQTFLLCSLLPHNVPILVLLKYSMGLGLFQGVSTIDQTWDRLLTLVSHLKSSCLLLDSYNPLRFDMHDLVRDVAISIASKVNHVLALREEDVLRDWPDGETMKACDKISLLEVGISKLPEQLKCPKLTFFYMFSKDPSMKMPANLFEEMKNLKVLHLTNMHIPSLPSSISLLTNLRTLCLDLCVLGDIAIIGELTNLETLSLVDSDIEMLPKEMGQLLKLKLLDLSDCTKLRIIPAGVFSSLSRLEELRMGNSFVQWEEDGDPTRRNNASLAEFKAFSDCLTAVEVQIPNAKIIPKDFFFEKLKRYKIIIGEAWDWDGRIEEWRTLKLQLQTSTWYLNAGMKMLMDKAENVHLHGRTGVEILLLELEDWKRLRELKNLHVQNGPMLKYIIKHDDVIDKIEFPQLQSLTLQDLPKLISFNSKNNGSNSICLQELPLFSEKIMVPKLEKLKLSSINIERIWDYQLPKGSTSSMRNLTSLIIEGCANLKYILSPSMVNCLQQLQVFEIIACDRIREVISIEEIMTEDANRATFSFARLKILKIEQCPELKGFINKSMSKDITAGSTNEAVLFNDEVTFPELEKMEISHLRNVKRIWYDQLYVDFFCKLKELKVEHCDGMLNVFPSLVLEAFQSLEKLRVTDCGSIEEVFGIKDASVVAAMQLRNLYLYRLPKLKHIWSKDPLENTTFQNLQYVEVWECWSLQCVFPFSIAKGLQRLESLVVFSCGVEEIVSNNREGLDQQETLFEFKGLSFLVLWNLPDLKCFYPGMHTTAWPVLKTLWTYQCEKILVFGQRESPQIQQSLFRINEAMPKMVTTHIKVLGICFYFNEAIAFPIHFLQRFYNLEMLVLRSFAFIELSHSKENIGEEKGMSRLPKIKKLKLNFAYKIRHLWNEDSLLENIFTSIETLEILNCHSLINLGSSASFENLTTLDVTKCKLISELFAPSKAQNLVHLVTMRIKECEVMKEVVASDDEAKYEIIFRELKHLELHCLPSLESFCSGNYTFKFPSLEQIIVTQCPSLKSFCQGDLSTSKLQRVQLKETDSKGRWGGNLNATIKQLHKEKVGHLKFSEIPELEDIWSRNPQEIVVLENLEFLEVCDSNKLKCILNLSIASSLGRLQQLEIRRCNNLEAVINEEEATKTTDDKIIIFPLLTSIIIESCADLRSFYWGSLSLIEFPSLVKIEVSRCPNMTSFFSTSSRDEDKQAIIGDGTEVNKNDLTALFCYKAAFPKLEENAISHLTNLKRIWCDQLHGNSFCNLKELKVKNCDQLLNIFPSPLLGVFQRLETLKVTDCGSLEEVFGIKDTCVIVAMLLRTLCLYGLPKLKTVFPFSIAKGLQQLESFEVDSCGVEEIVSKNSEGLEQESLFEFNRLSLLVLWDLPDLKCFYPGMHTTAWPALKRLRIYSCEKILFGQEECPQIQKPLFRIGEVIPQLEEVWFSSDHFATISEGQYSRDFFLKIKVLGINFYLNESIAFPIHFLHRFYNLETLVLGSFAFQELSPSKGHVGEGKEMLTLPKIKKLKLDFASKIRHLWNEDSLLENIFASLETLQIVNCHSLISLGSSSASFQNLTTLDVSECKGIVELITSSKAQSLERLVIMKITECEMMKEVVASEGDDEATHEIIFRKLEYLELHYLQSLRSFCSGNCTFKFPSLEQVIISQCPSLTSFSHGALSAPILRRVQLKETDSIRHWAGDLNAAIEQLHKEKVGYRGLKHLNFSKIPELVDIWSRNPQEILEFKNLEFLEVCNSNNLTCIMNLSMVSSLGRLQQLEIKGCNNLEAVIKEEEATIDDKIVTFRFLKSITMESCPDLTSFYLGSPSLIEFPSLEEIEISHCPSMTTFVSTLWRDEDKQPIIGDGTEGNKNDPPALFCNKAGFPKLKEIAISHLRNVKRIWYDDQLHVDSFCNLKKLTVEHCDQLLNIFPSHMLRVFQRLETLVVTDCGSLGEVFGIKDTCVVAMQLRRLDLYGLPKLKSVFPFPIARGLPQLECLIVNTCGVEEIVSKNSEGLEQGTLFEFNRLSFLSLWNLPDLKCFYPGIHATAWPLLKWLRTCGCKKIKILDQLGSQAQPPLFLIVEVIPQLEEVSFSGDDIAMICDGQFAADFFCHIKTLSVCSYHTESAVFPFGFLQRFVNLEWLGVYDCNFKELSLCKGWDNGGERETLTLPKVRHLKLSRLYKIEHLWNEDSPLSHICANLEALEVWYCDSLISLGSCSASFQNLTTLDVWKCKGIAELITSSKAKSLERLVKMRIRECEMLKEVVAREGDNEATYEITFKELESLELLCLQSLRSFCSENYTFKFPSLERVIVRECPSLKSFSQGALSTPNLQRVQLKETDSTGQWAGDLNATIEQIAQLSEKKNQG